jgi:DNA transposition AAA+ family ATPase
MKETFVETRNYIQIREAISSLLEQPPTTDRMGLAYGNFGLGKSVSLERIAYQEDAMLIRTDQTWSVTSTLRRLCAEMSIDESGSNAQLMERLVEALSLEPRLIIVDEVDTILRAEKVRVFELFRDLHDETRNVIFFVGMEEALAKIKRHRHYFSRLSKIVKFEPIGREDIAKFCALCEVEIGGDLLEYFAKRYANLRQIKVFLIRLEEWAELNDVERIGLNEFKASGVER